MGGAAHALKRLPRIKFPPRHPKPSECLVYAMALSAIATILVYPCRNRETQKSITGYCSASGTQPKTASADAPRNFFSRPPSMTPGGKASDQPKRTPVSPEEIDAILLGGSL